MGLKVTPYNQGFIDQMIKMGVSPENLKFYQDWLLKHPEYTDAMVEIVDSNIKPEDKSWMLRRVISLAKRRWIQSFGIRHILPHFYNDKMFYEYPGSDLEWISKDKNFTPWDLDYKTVYNDPNVKMDDYYNPGVPKLSRKTVQALYSPYEDKELMRRFTADVLSGDRNISKKPEGTLGPFWNFNQDERTKRFRAMINSYVFGGVPPDALENAVAATNVVGGQLGMGDKATMVKSKIERDTRAPIRRPPGTYGNIIIDAAGKITHIAPKEEQPDIWDMFQKSYKKRTGEDFETAAFRYRDRMQQENAVESTPELSRMDKAKEFVNKHKLGLGIGAGVAGAGALSALGYYYLNKRKKKREELNETD